MSALKTQVGGDHYSKLVIQPVQYIMANNLPFAEGCVVKYITRWRDKGGVADLEKARHFLDILIEAERQREEKTDLEEMKAALKEYGIKVRRLLKAIEKAQG